MPSDIAGGRPCHRGPLVSVEGISGVGKSYLMQRLADDLIGHNAEPLVLEEFSARQQPGRRDLGRDLLQVLISASGGDRFLRGGHLATETLSLLAIKMFDYETSRNHLARGRTVIEGRSLHTVAIYQSIIQSPNDEGALEEAREILGIASQWRPLPDLTILITDDIDVAVRRTEERERRPLTAGELRIHHRAAALYQKIAADDPGRIRVLDRRLSNETSAIQLMKEWISNADGKVSCLRPPLLGGCLCE
jgi:dTMP kinase